MEAKPKVLWISDSARCFWVGQSIVTREICKRLMSQYDIIQGGYLESKLRGDLPRVEFPIIPIDRVDTKQIIETINKVQPQCVVFSHDIHRIGNVVEIRKGIDQNIRLLGYITIDGHPINPVFRQFYDALDSLVVPSHYAASVLRTQWFDTMPDAVIPYGVDHNIFRPPTVSKLDVKASLQEATSLSRSKMLLKDKFVCCFAGHNQTKKNIGAIADAWRMFEKGKDNVMLVLLLHSASVQDDLLAYDDSLFYEIQNAIIIKQVLQVEDWRTILGASDVLAFPSLGEGFGLPPLEAMACGTVPIVVPFAALNDYCNEDNSYLVDYTLLRGELSTLRSIANYDSLLRAYERAYADWGSGALVKKSNAAMQTASAYSWDTTAKMLSTQIDAVIQMDRLKVHLTLHRVI